MKIFKMLLDDGEKQKNAIKSVHQLMHCTREQSDHPMSDLAKNFLEDPDSVEYDDLVTFIDDYACPDMCLGINSVRFAAMLKSLSRHMKQKQLGPWEL